MGFNTIYNTVDLGATQIAEHESNRGTTMPNTTPQPAPEHDPDWTPPREVEFPPTGDLPPAEQIEIPLPRRENTPEYPEETQPNRGPEPDSSYTEEPLIDLRPPRFEALVTPRAQADRSAGTGPNFGGFRPILRMPDTQEGLGILLFLEQRGRLSQPESCDTGRFLDPFENHHRITPQQATALAEGTFPRGTPGYFLAEDLAMALLTNRLDLFTEHDRTRYAALYAQQLFEDDPVGTRNCQNWILGRTTIEQENEFHRALLQRGSLVHEAIPGKLWLQLCPIIRSSRWR